MNTIKKYYNRFLSLRFGPYIFLAFTYIPFFILRSSYTVDDDSMFTGAYQCRHFLSWSLMRYRTHTSRSVIEAVTVFFCNYTEPHIWSVFNLLMLLITLKLFTYLLFDDDRYSLWLCALGFQFIPAAMLTETGTVTIAACYLWTFTMSLAVFIPFKLFFRNDRVSPAPVIFSYLALIYAGNMENYLLMIIIILILIFAWMIFTGRRFRWFMSGYIIITLAQLLYFLTCPGNMVRAGSGYSSKSPIYRIIKGFFSYSIYYFNDIDFQFIFVLLLTMYLCVYCRYIKKNTVRKIYAVISAVLIAASFIISYLYYIAAVPKRLRFLFNMQPFSTSRITLPEYIIETVFYLFLLVWVLMIPLLFNCDHEIFVTLRRNRTHRKLIKINGKYIIVLEIILSVFSRMVFGFSPSVHPYAHRLSFLSTLGFVTAIITMLKSYKNRLRYTDRIFKAVALMSFLKNVITLIME